MSTTEKIPVLVAILLALPAAAYGVSGTGGSIEATVRTKHDRGEVRCALHDRKNWMGARSGEAIAKPKKGRAVCAFDGVPHGAWAISVHHDENGDGEMETNFLGIPKEGWGVSRNAPAGAFGAPDFDDTRFVVSDEPVSLTIKIRY